MAKLAEAGGSGTSPNATKTAAQIAAEAAAVAPISGVVPNFKPAVKMPKPATTPGDAGFVGPVPTTPAAPDYGAIPYGTPVPKFTPEVKYPTGVAAGSAGFVGPTTTTANTTGMDQDAFDRLMSQLNQWNLGSLSGVITQLLTQGMTFDSVLAKIKYDKTINPATGKAYNADYTLRFAGNQSRIDKGLNALTERQYIDNENSYAETLKAYGLNNMLSVDRTANEAKFATYIANDLSPVEFKDRIDLAATRVLNMDPAIQKNFQEYYPGVTKTDLISYFLAPDETLPLLKTKVNAAEIGAAAGYQGLGIGVGRAEELAKFGESYEQAKVDYSKVAEVLPTGQKLSSIYNEEGIAYNQGTAEDEFIKNDAAAKLKRNRLASKERASFQGDSGLSSQFSSLGKSIQGKF